MRLDVVGSAEASSRPIRALSGPGGAVAAPGAEGSEPEFRGKASLDQMDRVTLTVPVVPGTSQPTVHMLAERAVAAPAPP